MRFLIAIPVLAASLLCAAQRPGQALGFSSGSRIGVALRDVDADRAAMLKLSSVTGTEVVAIEAGSPAEQAGVKVGDVLLSYNRESIVGGQQLGRLVSETPVGRKIRLEYWRDGKVLITTVTTGARVTSDVSMQNRSALGVAFPKDVGDVFIISFPTPHVSWINSQFGIECEDLDVQSAQLAEFFGVKHGVLIRAVAKDSPAAKSGLRAGDVLTQIDGHSIADSREVDAWLQRESRSAKSFPVGLMRDHKPASVKVNLAPEMRDDR